MTTEKTHYRKAFHSPYLSSADIVEPTVLTVARVTLEQDLTKRTKDYFNTLHFAEKFIRTGEVLKPMILNATNSKTMASLAGSSFIDDWLDLPITIYVETGVKFGRETVDGLRIRSQLAERPLSDITDARLEKAAAAIKAGTYTTVMLREKFALTPAQDAKLVKLLSDEPAESQKQENEAA